MTITNHGPGDVYGLDFEVADDRSATREWREEGFPVPKLPAGKSVNAARFMTLASTDPAYFSASFSISGATNRHGPHQAAQKSTITGLSFSMTSCLKLASVASRTLDIGM